MRHGLYIYKKRERKDGMPKKHDPKKERKNMDTSMSMKKKKDKKNIFSHVLVLSK